MSLIYGLYRIETSDVEEIMKMARECGINKFDTAPLYGNENECADHSIPSDFITTKIYNTFNPAQVQRAINRLQNSRSFDGILFHHPMSNSCWAALIENRNGYKELGVCNYDIDRMRNLLTYCKLRQLPIPNVHQMEVHPFIDCIPLIRFCQSNKITVQGHTVLTQGKFLAYPPLIKVASKYTASPSQILIAWAHSLKIDVCINTSSPNHLKELTCFVELTPDDISDMNFWHTRETYRFYIGNF